MCLLKSSKLVVEALLPALSLLNVMLEVVNVAESMAASFGSLATGYLANHVWRWSFVLCRVL